DADREPFTLEGKRDAPLRIWIAPKEEKQRVEAAVAEEIAFLLASNAAIGGRRVEPRDIAVLVTTNFQPAKIRNALTRFRIPSVVYTAASVFKSTEAEELLAILRAVAAPTDERKVRAALATETLGRSASVLEGLATDERAWEQTLNGFAEYHAAWRD